MVFTPYCRAEQACQFSDRPRHLSEVLENRRPALVWRKLERALGPGGLDRLLRGDWPVLIELQDGNFLRWP